ncbi:endonuclease III [Cesiribacter sp. SM1]|uniref:endonuclease III domain-containing protein n=1 Tax=Cesiribacter sp. SM1 TaxID=2861196 RepID=UPI001CD69B20|nr:endonuclease III [Cesiribacter sp. SM1]
MSPSEKLQESRQRLLSLWGPQQAHSKREPLQELIMTILSHRTDYVSEKKAYERMWERFGSWEGIRDAPLEELIEMIKPASYPEVKAPYIKQTLAQIIAERGAPSLDFLEAMPTQEAMDWLLRLPGVGPKTATLLLLFNFKKPVLPVDTHVHRVSIRVGILPPRTSADKAHKLLLAQLPADADALFTFHKHFFWHGQRVCHAVQPKCYQCVLNDFCSFYQEKAPPPKQQGRIAASGKTDLSL